MGRIFKGQTERIVILLTPQESKDLTDTANALNKKVSAIGRELIIQYIKDHRLDRIVDLMKKQNEITGTNQQFGVFTDKTNGNDYLLTNTQVDRLKKDYNLKPWTGESKPESVQAEPVQDDFVPPMDDITTPEPSEIISEQEQPSPVDEPQTPPQTEQTQDIPINPIRSSKAIENEKLSSDDRIPGQIDEITYNVKYKELTIHHRRKWGTYPITLIPMDQTRFNEIERHIINKSNNKGYGTDIETIRERLNYTFKFTMSELLTVIIKSDKFEYNPLGSSYDLTE